MRNIAKEFFAGASSERSWPCELKKFVRRHPWLLKFAFPIAASGIALALSLLIDRYTDAPVLALFVLAVALSAWVGGSTAGTFALLTGFPEAIYFFYYFHSEASLSQGVVRIVSNFVVGLLLVLIISRLRAADLRNEQMSAIVNGADDSIISKTLDGKITSWNRGAERLYGYTETEAVGQPISILVPSDKLPEFEEIMARLRQGQRIELWETIRRKKDGTFVQVAAKISPIVDSTGTIIGASSIAHEITERKAAEAALRHSEQRHRELAEELRDERAKLSAVIENLPIGIGMCSPSDNLISLNKVAMQLHGFNSEKEFYSELERYMKGFELLDLEGHVVPPEQWPVSRAVRHDFVSGLELIVRNKVSGAERILSYSAAPVHSGRGDLLLIVFLIQDLTPQKQAEQALRRSEQRLRRFYESGMVGVTYWNMDGEITEANDKFLEMVGYTRDDLKSGLVNWARMTPPEYAAADEEALADLRANGVDTPYEKEYIRKDGIRIAVVVGAAMLDDVRHEGIAFVLDVTKHRRAEQALIRSEKLASVGRMAATVAHEINNPLEIITNSVYIASRDASLSLRAREILGIAEQELLRVAHLTRQTLGFYRESTAPATFDTAVLLSELVDLYAPKLQQRGIDVYARNSGDSHVTAIAGEIRQVASNIIANSIDACSGGGKLHVRSSVIAINGANWTRLTVADTGDGIAPEHLGRIFEPFFTTKESFGTGLGLWVSKEIVARHGGKIRVRSRKGEGSVFSIWLPATEGKRGLTTASAREYVAGSNPA